MSATFSVVVTHGLDIGARVLLGADPKVVGRARDAALPLTDPSVSRRHVELSLSGDTVVAQVLPGASPFVHEGRRETKVVLRARESITVGSTVLVVTVTPGERHSVDAERTEAHRLLDGAGGETRGLGDVFALVEALDETVDELSAPACLSAWAGRTLGATSATLTTAGADASPDTALRSEIVVAPTDTGGTVIVVPLDLGVRSVRFEVPRSPDRLSLAERRLLVVGARIFSQRLAALVEVSRAREEAQAMRAQAIGSASDFLGTSLGAAEVTRLLPKLAASDATVLILGESGSGKTFVARLIHEASARKRDPLRVINCAAIPDSLVESALFGHERGAFTGADATRPGAFEVAAGGTVLLDEIGDLPLASQAKLLRVLEDRVFERVGSQRTIPLRARVLAATNHDLARAVAAGTFRSDLFYRVSVVSLAIPPLRERADDIPMLARRILADLVSGAGRRVTGFEAAALRAMSLYPWPGNVRELRNAVEHALVLGEAETVRLGDLPSALRTAIAPEPSPNEPNSVRLPARLDWLEARAIEAALEATHGNRTRAAALLGINRVTLYKKLKEPDG